MGTTTQIEYETVENEIELVICDQCECVIDEGEEIPVGIDLYHGSATNEIQTHRKVFFCKQCAQAIFDYERPDTTVGEYVEPFWWNMPEGFFMKTGYIFWGVIALIIVFLMVP